jgi:hypothetical protein
LQRREPSNFYILYILLASLAEVNLPLPPGHRFAFAIPDTSFLAKNIQVLFRFFGPLED